MLPKLVMPKKIEHPLKMKLNWNNKFTNEDSFYSLGSPSNKKKYISGTFYTNIFIR